MNCLQLESQLAELKSFCPLPYSKIPLGLHPLLRIKPLTWPVLQSNVSISSSAKKRKWKHGAKQGSRCLAQRPSWMKLLPLHPQTRYLESYKTHTRNRHLGSKSRLNCVPKFPTKQTPTQGFQESTLRKMECATDPQPRFPSHERHQLPARPPGREEGQCPKSHSDPCSLHPPPITAHFPVASTLHLKCILIKEFTNCTRSF